MIFMEIAISFLQISVLTNSVLNNT